MLPVDYVIDGVYIAGFRATEYANDLRGEGITNILKLYEDIPYFPADFNVLENPLDDGELIALSVLNRGVKFIQENVSTRRPVLVMCTQGISRSSTFVLAYLVEKGIDLRQAYVLLREHHDAARPHPKLWQSLITHYGLKYGLQEVISWSDDKRVSP